LFQGDYFQEWLWQEKKKTRTSSPKLSKFQHSCSCFPDICQWLMPKRGGKERKKSFFFFLFFFFLKDDVNISDALAKEEYRWYYLLFVFKDKLNFPIKGWEHPVTNFLRSTYQPNVERSIYNSLSLTALSPIIKYLLYSRFCALAAPNLEFYLLQSHSEVVIIAILWMRKVSQRSSVLCSTLKDNEVISQSSLL